MLTRTQRKILALLLNQVSDEQLSIRGIARKLGLSYTLTYNNIINLDKERIVRKLEVPPAQIITIHDFAPTEVLVDIELERRNDFLKRNSWIKVMLDDIMSSVNNYFFVLLVFGSYSKGTETSKSDIDLLAITPKKDDDFKEIENAINKVYTKVKKGIIVVTVDNFKEMISIPQVLNVGNEARKTHIILYGVEQYYQILKKVYSK